MWRNVTANCIESPPKWFDSDHSAPPAPDHRRHAAFFARAPVVYINQLPLSRVGRAMRLALFAIAIVVAGCGSDLSRDQACADLATARCGALMTCSAPDLARRWPDIATCEAREKLACTDALAAPQTAA